jgi:hypothetical protein
VALGFIRYFAVTNDGPIGRAALAYLPSLLRIAPVRVISKSGQLEGAWRRFEALLLTPMSGTCVSCVCTHPSSWVWEQSIPMPSANVGVQSAATAVSTPQTGGIARGVVEIYTPKVRNVLFMVESPTTDAQRQTAAKYEAVICAYAYQSGKMQTGTLAGAFTAFVPLPVTDHAAVRAAVLGPPLPRETPYR